jgi:hypothetical protein
LALPRDTAPPELVARIADVEHVVDVRWDD